MVESYNKTDFLGGDKNVTLNIIQKISYNIFVLLNTLSILAVFVLLDMSQNAINYQILFPYCSCEDNMPIFS